MTEAVDSLVAGLLQLTGEKGSTDVTAAPPTPPQPTTEDPTTTTEPDEKKIIDPPADDKKKNTGGDAPPPTTNGTNPKNPVTPTCTTSPPIIDLTGSGESEVKAGAGNANNKRACVKQTECTAGSTQQSAVVTHTNVPPSNLIKWQFVRHHENKGPQTIVEWNKLSDAEMAVYYMEFDSLLIRRLKDYIDNKQSVQLGAIVYMNQTFPIYEPLQVPQWNDTLFATWLNKLKALTPPQQEVLDDANTVSLCFLYCLVSGDECWLWYLSDKQKKLYLLCTCSPEGQKKGSIVHFLADKQYRLAGWVSIPDFEVGDLPHYCGNSNDTHGRRIVNLQYGPATPPSEQPTPPAPNEGKQPPPEKKEPANSVFLRTLQKPRQNPANILDPEVEKAWAESLEGMKINKNVKITSNLVSCCDEIQPVWWNPEANEFGYSFVSSITLCQQPRPIVLGGRYQPKSANSLTIMLLGMLVQREPLPILCWHYVENDKKKQQQPKNDNCNKKQKKPTLPKSLELHDFLQKYPKFVGRTPIEQYEDRIETTQFFALLSNWLDAAVRRGKNDIERTAANRNRSSGSDSKRSSRSSISDAESAGNIDVNKEDDSDPINSPQPKQESKKNNDKNRPAASISSTPKSKPGSGRTGIGSGGGEHNSTTSSSKSTLIDSVAAVDESTDSNGVDNEWNGASVLPASASATVISPKSKQKESKKGPTSQTRTSSRSSSSGSTTSPVANDTSSASVPLDNISNQIKMLMEQQNENMKQQQQSIIELQKEIQLREQQFEQKMKQNFLDLAKPIIIPDAQPFASLPLPAPHLPDAQPFASPPRPTPPAPPYESTTEYKQCKRASEHQTNQKRKRHDDDDDDNDDDDGTNDNDHHHHLRRKANPSPSPTREKMRKTAVTKNNRAYSNDEVVQKLDRLEKTLESNHLQQEMLSPVHERQAKMNAVTLQLLHDLVETQKSIHYMPPQQHQANPASRSPITFVLNPSDRDTSLHSQLTNLTRSLY